MQHKVVLDNICPHQYINVELFPEQLVEEASELRSLEVLIVILPYQFEWNGLEFILDEDRHLKLFRHQVQYSIAEEYEDETSIFRVRSQRILLPVYEPPLPM